MIHQSTKVHKTFHTCVKVIIDCFTQRNQGKPMLECDLRTKTWQKQTFLFHKAGMLVSLLFIHSH